jgi:hypothetical protein
VGIAILTTASVARTDDLLAGGDQSVDPAVAMTESFQAAVPFGGGDRGLRSCPGHPSAVPAVEAAIVGTQE